MGIRAIFWDLGGVLVRTRDYASRNALAERLGLSRSELEEMVYAADSGTRAQLGEISIEQHWVNVLTALGLPVDELAEFQHEFWSGDSLDAELIEYIRGLRSRHRTGLISNAFSNLRQVVSEIWKFADAFDDMVISAEVGLAKPDARIYRLALERLGVQPEQAVFIDDMRRNVEGARAVNMHGIHFHDPQQVRGELAELLDEGQR
jgi:epoxide hydrolase-like predicted phosphatase